MSLLWEKAYLYRYRVKYQKKFRLELLKKAMCHLQIFKGPQFLATESPVKTMKNAFFYVKIFFPSQDI